MTSPWSGPARAARLRAAISGKNKSDVTDVDVLAMAMAMASDVFTLSAQRPPAPPQLALRRAVVRRGKLVIDGNRARRRLISLARWAFSVHRWPALAGRFMLFLLCGGQCCPGELRGGHDCDAQPFSH